jgi:hypothetical protein
MIHKFIIFLLLFISGGAIILLGVASYFYIIFMGILVVCFILSTKTIRVSWPTIRNILFLALLFIILEICRFESLFFGDNVNILLKFFILIIFSIYVNTFYASTESFFENVVYVFELMMKVSLVTIVCVNVAPGLLVNVGAKFDVTNDQFQTFFGLAFTRSADITKYHFYRNQSIFWEPGVYCVMINTVYMIKMLYLKQSRGWYWYVATIFSSFSMGGILIFGILNAGRLMLSGSKENVRQKLPALALLVGIPLLVAVDFVYAYSSDIEIIVGAIFHRDLTNDSSVNTRYQDFYYGFLAAQDQLALGHGQDFTDYYKVTLSAANTSKESYNGGITNSIISILYCYGVFYLVAYVIFMFKSAIQFSLRYALLIFFITVALLMLEPLQFSLFIIYLFTFKERKRKIAPVMLEESEDDDDIELQDNEYAVS